jgi:hypothetical protein
MQDFLFYYLVFIDEGAEDNVLKSEDLQKKIILTTRVFVTNVRIS